MRAALPRFALLLALFLAVVGSSVVSRPSISSQPSRDTQTTHTSAPAHRGDDGAWQAGSRMIVIDGSSSQARKAPVRHSLISNAPNSPTTFSRSIDAVVSTIDRSPQYSTPLLI